MKNTVKFIALAGIAISCAACNKAKFHEAAYVTFSSGRVNATEDAGIIAIPVQVYGAEECVITYSVTEGSAKEGVNYEVVDRNGKPDKTGVLTISHDKAVNDSIRIRIVDYTGVETGNLTFKVILKETAEDGIHLGALNNCTCTIIDNDGGLAKLIGDWQGNGNDLDGKQVDFTFSLQEYNPSSDPEAKYPEANCMLTDGKILFSSNGNDMDFKYPLYAYFDKNMSKLHVYGLQPFNYYNFGDLGVCFVAWGNNAGSFAELKSRTDIIINAGDGVLELDADMLLWLCSYDDAIEPNGYTAGSAAAGYTWTKK